MNRCLAFFFLVIAGVLPAPAADTEPANGLVYVIPVRDAIDRPMVYLVRRAVKEAMSAQADLIILDMDTNGGSVPATMDIMKILGEFKGRSLTYVNKKAFSAGAFISFATEKIYMAPQAVIGAAAPVMMAPGGSGTQDIGGTMEVKTISALSALVRAQAEKHGHNTEVAQAMIDKSKELTIDGQTLNKAGSILTLTDRQAGESYGNPPKPLLSAGTVESLEKLVGLEAPPQVRVHYIQPTGAERVGSWLTAISPLLLIIGVIGLYIEFKTPGFGLPGIIGLSAFGLYFFAGFAAGLSGLEWIIIFLVGLALVIVEFFVLPGTMFIGLAGAALMFLAIVMALVDVYPRPGPGLPTLPQFETFALPVRTLALAILGSIIGVALLSRLLPKTSLYRQLVSHGASGSATEALLAQQQQKILGQTGVTISPLYPGGKAKFGEQIVDVTSQGEYISARSKVKVIGFQNNAPIVEEQS